MQEVPKSDVTQLQRLFYDIDRIRVRGVANQLQRTDSTNTYKGDREMSVCEMQKEYASRELDFSVARYTLEQALVSGVRELTTGKPAAPLQSTSRMPPSAGVNESSSQAGYTLIPTGFTPKPSRTIGRVYCKLLAKISGSKVPPLVKPANAAEVPRVQQPVPQKQQPVAKPVQQDTTGRRPAPKRIIMGGSTAAPAPSPRLDTVPPPTTTPPGQSPAIAPIQTPSASGTTSGFMPPPGTVASAAGSLDVAATVDAARNRMAENRASMNQYGVEIQKKFALSAACIVFVLIGAPIALRFPRGGVGLVIGVSLGVFAIYYVGLIAGESLANRAFLTPFWAMWAANVILTAVGLVLLAQMGKEGATSRGGDLSEFADGIKTRFAKLGRLLGFRVERRHPVT